MDEELNSNETWLNMPEHKFEIVSDDKMFLHNNNPFAYDNLIKEMDIAFNDGNYKLYLSLFEKK